LPRNPFVYVLRNAKVVGINFKTHPSNQLIPIPMLRVALVLVFVSLSMAVDSDAYSPVSSSSDIHPRKRLSFRRCTSLASQLSHSSDIGEAAADSRSSTVYNAVHTLPSRPLRRSIERSHRRLSPSRFCRPPSGDSVYTELQTQLYPEIRF
jgi:hypothetical protein